MATIRIFKGHIGIKTSDSSGFKRIPVREIIGIRTMFGFLKSFINDQVERH
jgi:hypothetical protein